MGLAAQQWITVYNKCAPMKQRYHYNVTTARLLVHVQKGWEENLFISSVACSQNMWGIVMDAGTLFTQQIYKVRRGGGGCLHGTAADQVGLPVAVIRSSLRPASGGRRLIAVMSQDSLGKGATYRSAVLPGALQPGRCPGTQDRTCPPGGQCSATP